MMETDDELRAHIRYVAGDSPELRYAKGTELDQIAERRRLKRLKKTAEPSFSVSREKLYGSQADWIDGWARLELQIRLAKLERELDEAAMVEHDQTFVEALEGRGIPESTARDLVRAAGLVAELEAAYETISFPAQARATRLGDRFAEAVRRLRPLADRKIARRLGVTAMTVNNIRRRKDIK